MLSVTDKPYCRAADGSSRIFFDVYFVNFLPQRTGVRDGIQTLKYIEAFKFKEEKRFEIIPRQGKRKPCWLPFLWDLFVCTGAPAPERGDKK